MINEMTRIFNELHPDDQPRAVFILKLLQEQWESDRVKYKVNQVQRNADFKALQVQWEADKAKFEGEKNQTAVK